MADVLGQKASRRWCHPPPSAKESYQFHGREYWSQLPSKEAQRGAAIEILSRVDARR